LVHRRQPKSGKKKTANASKPSSTRQLAVLLALPVPALIALGFARGLSGTGWLATCVAAAAVEAGILFYLVRSSRKGHSHVAGSPASTDHAEPEQDAPVTESRDVANELLVSLARRNQSLLHRQLAKIDELEAREQDPVTLGQLFAIDHLATRMRRNAESLLVLTGEESVRKLTRPMPMSEIIRGAVAEIEDYQRVDVSVNGDADVVGRAVVDIVHLLAELIENAAAFSPPASRVSLTGTRSRHGYSVTIADHGVGFASDDLAAKNALLATPDHESVPVSEMLGFHVVRRLANRYDLTVRLASQPGAGTVVTVGIPSSILMREVQQFPAEAPAPEPNPEPVATHAAFVPRQFLPADMAVEAPATPAPAMVPAAYATPASPAPAAPAAPVTAPEPAPVVAASGLTQRVPFDSLAPQMRNGSVSPVLPDETAASPAPEHARSLLSAYRTGLDLGRSGIMDSAGLTPDRYAAPTDHDGETS